MRAKSDPVVEAALSLSPEERARLADRLLESLQAECDDEAEREEVEHRLEALRRGDSAWLESHAAARR
ncbi:MAG: addiction module protein [Planctomycetes bacterium]|nr:addiction module protein [Planctomycetota bacterium]